LTAEDEARLFIESYTTEWLELWTKSAEAEWMANIRIVDGDTTLASASASAQAELAAFEGSTYTVAAIQELLARRSELDPLSVMQLDKMLYRASKNPQTIKDLVDRRIRLKAELTDRLFGFDFKLGGRSVSTNEIDNVLRDENDLSIRLAAWRASKEVGAELKDGLAELRDARNATVRALGYDDYFAYEVSEYGMSPDEMVSLANQFSNELYPLYRELHTWARYELAERFGLESVPDLLPAHWLPDRWGQDWNALVNPSGLDLDATVGRLTPDELVRQGEEFYVSIGFETLPESFYELSSLFPVPPGSAFKKNNHASAWHMDRGEDVRLLMSVEPNARWYETTHHELGHVYYYMEYSNPEVPPILRRGANRAFHEAIGSLMGFAAMQQPFLSDIGLLPQNAVVDETEALLKEALNYVVFIPWSAGVMTEFERDLYARDLPVGQFNERWWELVEKYQGIAPPTRRGEEYCDAASKTHIIDDAAQYYDYALSYVLLFQFHDHIARNILQQDTRATSYFASREVGEFLRGMLRVGETRDWRELLRETLGGDISAKPMLEYFAPLMTHLRTVNAGRRYTLPRLPAS
jgi:peptidyl-dipeptidase A